MKKMSKKKFIQLGERIAGEIMGKRKEMKNGFEKGVVYACARLVELFDQPSMAKDILKESGVDISKANKYDRSFLEEL